VTFSVILISVGSYLIWYGKTYFKIGVNPLNPIRVALVAQTLADSSVPGAATAISPHGDSSQTPQIPAQAAPLNPTAP